MLLLLLEERSPDILNLANSLCLCFTPLLYSQKDYRNIMQRILGIGLFPVTGLLLYRQNLITSLISYIQSKVLLRILDCLNLKLNKKEQMSCIMSFSHNQNIQLSKFNEANTMIFCFYLETFLQIILIVLGFQIPLITFVAVNFLEALSKLDLYFNQIYIWNLNSTIKTSCFCNSHIKHVLLLIFNCLL